MIGVFEKTVSIGEMRAEDVSAVKALEVASGLSAWSAGDYLAEIGRPDAVTLVARSADGLAGFAVARLITISDHADPRSGTVFEMELNNLAVEPSYRRCGIARRICGELLKRLPSLDGAVVFLEVREKNGPARAFYKTIGMKETGLRRNFYREPADNAIVVRGTASEMATNLILKTKID